MRALVISVIVFVAVIMGMSSVAPVAQVYAEHSKSGGGCPDIGPPPGPARKLLIFFVHRDAVDGDPDRNGNGSVCDLVNAKGKPTKKILVTIDDILALG